MQKNRVNNSINGVGIYETLVNDKRFARSEIQVSSSNVKQRQEANLHDVNNNPVSIDDELLIESELKVVDILDVLDQQVKTLNELREPRNKSEKELRKSEEGDSKIYENLILCSSTTNIAELKDESDALSKRKSLLDHYIRNNISSDSNCSCHFHFGSNELKLLNELNECYRKFCQFNSDKLEDQRLKPQQPQQVTEEVLSFIECEGEISAIHTDCANQSSSLCGANPSEDHKCTFCTDHEATRSQQNHGLRRQQQPSSSSTHKCSGLFIDSQSLHSNEGNRLSRFGQRRGYYQLAFSKSESEIYSLANRIREPSCSISNCSLSDLLSEFELDAADSGSQLLDSHDADERQLDSASISECHIGNEAKRLTHATSESLLHLNDYESSAEYEQQNALVGVEELPVSDLDFVRRHSPNESKRKKGSAELPAKRCKRVCDSSSLETSSTNQSNLSDYQLGCNLTNDSLTSLSRSSRHYSPFDHLNYCLDESLNTLDLTAGNHSHESDKLILECGNKYRVTYQSSSISSNRSLDDYSQEGNLLFVPTKNYHSIESCSSCYELEEVKVCQQFRNSSNELRASTGCSHLDYCLTSDECAKFELLSKPTSPQTMESDELENQDNENNLAHKLKGADRLRNSAASLSTKANGPAAGACMSHMYDQRDPGSNNPTAKSSKIFEHNEDDDYDKGDKAKITKTKRPQQQIKGKGARRTHRSQRSLANCLAANSEVNKRSTSVGSGGMMKAAKDIAKLTIPSLASLQYLPGQLDVRGSRSVDRLAATSPKKHEMAFHNAKRLNVRELEQASPVTAQTDVSSSTRTSTLSSECRGSESTSKQHDGSCLLHRLCLCNCLARPHNDNVKKVKNRTEDDHKSEAETRGTPSPKHSAQVHKSAKADKNVSPVASARASAMSSYSSEETNLREVQLRVEKDSRLAERAVLGADRAGLSETSSCAKKNLTQPQGGRVDEGMMMRGEKQSPSFMSLLKPNKVINKRAESYKSQNYDDLRVVAQQERVGRPARDLQLKKVDARSTICSDGLGSIGDLAASGRSSASDSHTSDCLPVTHLKCNNFKNTTKFGNNTEVLGDDKFLTKKNPKQDNKNASSCLNPLHKTKRQPTYKRLLSPRKFFTSSSSVCDCDEGHENQPRSFLSRSLSRLSGRQKRTGLSRRRQLSTSPCASILNNSQTSETHSCSIDTLDDVNLNLSLPFNINDELLGRHYHQDLNATRLQRAPDIVLSRVEYQDVDSNSSCDMTRSLSGHHNYRPGSAQSSRSHEAHFDRDQSHRHAGSELSFNTSDMSGSFHQSHKPCSLPGSPRTQRRYRTRSPRLSQSPVPFHSPANESTKIEDGLKVCSTEHFEKHIGNIKDNQVMAQKKLFTAWINHFAPNFIRHDLFVELQDGIKLIGLLAILTHDKKLFTKYERLNNDKQSYIDRLVLTPSSRLKHLSNISIAIDYLRENLGMKLVNLNPMDIVSGKANVILGLCWNIILHFQFDRSFLKSSDSSSNNSSSISQSTSRFATSNTNEDRARQFNNRQVEEFTSKDIANARNRILDHINKRFNLKLTNLTSSLVDGDVLLAIIRTLLNSNTRIDLSGQVYKSKTWDELSDDEKLDCSFQLAKDYLDVPNLISAADLKQQTIYENNSKPLLVYLSMLLKANPRNCSTDQMLELRQLDESLKKVPEAKQDKPDHVKDLSSIIAHRLDCIDTKDKFNIDKLQSTLSSINEIDSLIESQNHDGQKSELDQKLVMRQDKLKEQAKQVEFLIDWINEADKLFESVPRSSQELAQAITEYQKFFSPTSLPKVNTTLCPTLERQYRECLATAKQRVLSMEQTMKNWISYDRASHELKKWLITAETKLIEALRPNAGHYDNSKLDEPPKPIDLHMSHLDDLVDYFELEPISVGDFDEYLSSFSPARSVDGLLSSSPSIDRSLSGSLVSLGSTGSRLACSKRATYHRLFDEFELKCRLLAAMLEPEQRDELLIGVKELKSKLKYITEYKVPQVISEIRVSINRCEMSIQEQDECCSDPDDYREENLDKFYGPTCGEETTSGPSTNVVSDEFASAPVASIKDDFASEKQTNGIDLSTTTSGSKKNKAKWDNGKNSKSRGNRLNKLNKNKPVVKTAIKLTRCKIIDDDDDEAAFIRRFWNKIRRASRISLTFNIVLLLCLAGICVVPLIQRDACCELNQPPIPFDKFTIHQRPT